MTAFLPLFPLNIVAYPGEQVNLHIFEPRYKQLIQECNHNGSTFGISPHINGRLMTIGTEMQLTEIVKMYENGEMDIRTLGSRKYSLEKFIKVVQGKLYSGADVQFLETEPPGDWGLREEVVNLLDQLSGMLEVEKSLHEGVENFISYQCGHYIGLSVEEEYTLLSLNSENERLNFLRNQLQKILPRIENMYEVKKRIMMNGHFRELDSPGY
jgi:hypothetical protein